MVFDAFLPWCWRGSRGALWRRTATALFQWYAVLTAGLLFLLICRGQAQVAISGITDRTVYSDRATFLITNQPGFTYLALLDGQPVEVGVSLTVTAVDYHELWVYRTNTATLSVTNQLVRFIVRSSARGGSEDGIPPWTPYPTIPSSSEEIAGANLRLVLPSAFPTGYPIPVIAWVENTRGHAVRANGTLSSPGQPGILIRRGVGSGFLASTNSPGSLLYGAQLAGLQASKSVLLESQTSWTPVSGTLDTLATWPAGSRWEVTNSLTVPTGGTLTIGPGTVVRLAAGVNFTNQGTILIQGTTEEPVVFMPAVAGQPWGGFILHTAGARLLANGAIFTGSGSEPCWFDSQFCSRPGAPTSHRGEQALFSCIGSGITLSLTHSAAIFLAGQLGHAVAGGSYTLQFDHFLMQGCTTGGEYTGANFTVNDSAFIQCPAETPAYADGDNDALYIVSGTHGFTNTLFGWTKDDGIDSGGSGSGTYHYQNCWFESTFHEGNSLSGTGKLVTHQASVFINCGQGLEAGYESPAGNLVECLATANQVGARFGDNYPWTYAGSLRATNSLLLYNHHDVWGMNWQDWTYRTNAMTIRGNWLTAPAPLHPDNEAWEPSRDAGRLAAFLTTPPEASVGLGLALWNTQLTFASLPNPVPVRLSSFSTNLLSVGYRLESATSVLAAGRLEFQPGQTVKFISPPATLPPENALLRLRLEDPAQARLTGPTQAWYTASPGPGSITLIPAGAQWKYLDSGTNPGTAWRQLDFDDSAWRSGPAELGYGDAKDGRPEATPLSYGPNSSSKYITYYFRTTFTATNPTAWSGLNVKLLRDDGGIVYLNGTEIFRSNLASGPVDYLTQASLAADDGTTFYSTNAPASLLRAGTNLIAVEVHQESATSSDLSFDLALEAIPRTSAQLVRFGEDWLVAWDYPAAVLEQAADLSGPWTPVQTASPHRIAPTLERAFYRLATGGR
jgi:hypothetical protein